MLLLTSCCTYGTNGVVEIAPNTYMIGGFGGWGYESGSSVKANFFKEAATFCAKRGMTVAPLNSTSENATKDSYASAEVQFRCTPP